jgi:hypothetical protein
MLDKIGVVIVEGDISSFTGAIAEEFEEVLKKPDETDSLSSSFNAGAAKFDAIVTGDPTDVGSSLSIVRPVGSESRILDRVAGELKGVEVESFLKFDFTVA